MPSQSSLKCAFALCEESCEDEKAMAHHVAHEHRRWKCVEPSCVFEVIKEYDNLIEHVHEKHQGVGPISCPMCDYEQKPYTKEEDKIKYFANWCRHATQKHLDPESAYIRRSGRCGNSTIGQGDDNVEAPTTPSNRVDENGNEIKGDEDDDKSPTSDDQDDDKSATSDDQDDDKSPISNDGGSSSDNSGDEGIFPCPACFRKFDRIDQHMLHLKNTHKTRGGKAECKECKEGVVVEEIAKHGLQKHIKEFFVCCHFCDEEMTYNRLIMHALECTKRPAALDNATLLRALAEGRVPERLSATKGG